MPSGVRPAGADRDSSAGKPSNQQQRRNFDIENPLAGDEKERGWKFGGRKRRTGRSRALKNPLLDVDGSSSGDAGEDKVEVPERTRQMAATGCPSASSEQRTPQRRYDMEKVIEIRDILRSALHPDPTPFEFHVPKDPCFHARFCPWMAWLLAWTFVGELFVNGMVFVDAGQAASASHDCWFRFEMFGYVACAADSGYNSQFGPTVTALERSGGTQHQRIVSHGEWWRLWTGCFLHTGLSHLFNNVVMLLWLGLELESVHGPWRVAAVYVVSGVFSTTASVPFESPGTVSVGASGCIFGLLGSTVGHVMMNWQSVNFPWFTLAAVIVQTFLQVVYGMRPSVNNLAHVFGYLNGFVSAWIFYEFKTAPVFVSVFVQRALATTIIAVVNVWGVMFLYGSFGPAEEVCPACVTLNCKPFPWGCDSSPETTGECWWSC